MPAQKEKDSSVDFLIAEFEALQQRAHLVEQSKTTSTNLYLLIVAAALAGTPGLLSLVPKNFTTVILIAALVFILVAGLLTLEYSITQSVVSIMLYRRAGRIRRWFLEQDSTIGVYLPFAPNDDSPAINVPLLESRGIETTAFIINVLAAAAIVGVALSLLSWIAAIIAAALTAVLAWFLQRAYARRKLRRAEAEVRHRVKFPSEIEERGVN